MDSEFYIVTEKHENHRVALRKMESAIRDLMKKGYFPTGSMLYLVTRDGGDTFPQHTFVQPMALEEKMR